MIKALADRPWIWIIVAFVVLIAFMTAFFVISVKYEQKEVPVPHQRGDY